MVTQFKSERRVMLFGGKGAFKLMKENYLRNAGECVTFFTNKTIMRVKKTQTTHFHSILVILHQLTLLLVSVRS